MRTTCHQSAAIFLQLAWSVLPLMSSTLVRAADAPRATDQSVQGNNELSEELRLAQADQPSAALEVEPGKEESDKKAERLEEVVVTGTHIPGVSPASPLSC